MREVFGQFWKDFVGAFVVLGAAITVYVAVGRAYRWIVIVALLGAFLTATRRQIGHLFARVGRRVRSMLRAKALEGEVAQLKRQLSDNAQQYSAEQRQWELSVREARRETLECVLGIAFSEQVGDVEPGVCYFADDRVLVVTGSTTTTGSYGVGARFVFCDRFDRAKGIVEVIRIDDDGTLHMRCVKELMAEFWDVLRSNAAVASRAPEGTKLRPTTLEDYPAEVWGRRPSVIEDLQNEGD